MTWQRSPGYGSAVLLGPAQADVWRVVWRMTEGGRRPELTLAELATLTGRSPSTVHSALGRLRALGLIGCAARMGRTGGHRLWRIRSRIGAALDPVRRRIAIARLRARWLNTQARADRGSHEPTAPAGPDPLWPAPSLHDPDRTPDPGDLAGAVSLAGGGPGPDDPYPRRSDPRETFAEKMRRYGIGGWVDEHSR